LKIKRLKKVVYSYHAKFVSGGNEQVLDSEVGKLLYNFVNTPNYADGWVKLVTDFQEVFASISDETKVNLDTVFGRIVTDGETKTHLTLEYNLFTLSEMTAHSGKIVSKKSGKRGRAKKALTAVTLDITI
jgi:hypothetical protein